MQLPQVEVRSRTETQATRGRRATRTVRWQILLLVWGCAPVWPAQAVAAAVERPQLRIAAVEFSIVAEANAATTSRVGARATEVAGPLKTTVLLLEDADTRLCLVTTHFGGTTPANVNQLIRQSLAKKMGLPPSHVWIFTSHNHSSVNFAENSVAIYDVPTRGSAPAELLPIGFLQGCAGDVNSKEMFTGGVKRATELGQMLGQSYVAALAGVQPSGRDGLDVAVETVGVPLAPLPSRDVLRAELAEMEAFLRRAEAGDEDTRSCVGLNFPRALTPKYRGRLVEPLRAWNLWALGLHDAGQAGSVPQHLELEIAVIRLGDVAIVGLPCEPFQGIGRLIRRDSPLPLSIPCGYANVSHGYITDGPNTGDREYNARWRDGSGSATA